MAVTSPTWQPAEDCVTRGLYCDDDDVYALRRSNVAYRQFYVMAFVSDCGCTLQGSVLGLQCAKG